MSEGGREERFGCERCWPASADDAQAARASLACDAELIDGSHFHVTLRTCRACGQRFVSVFTEMVDWADGDDPQAWALLPVTEDESADLRRGGPPSEAKLAALGPERRCLRHESPKGAPPRTRWATGNAIAPHD